MMSRSPIRNAKHALRFDLDERLRARGPQAAMDDLRLKAALKRAVAKIDAPAYLIDAIRREIRK
jgi:hypothetical protein